MRSAQAACSGLWVTISKAAAWSFTADRNESMIRRPAAGLTLPVGSSARTMSGAATRARAMEASCISPPESWKG